MQHRGWLLLCVSIAWDACKHHKNILVKTGSLGTHAAFLSIQQEAFHFVLDTSSRCVSRHIEVWLILLWSLPEVLCKNVSWSHVETKITEQSQSKLSQHYIVFTDLKISHFIEYNVSKWTTRLCMGHLTTTWQTVLVMPETKHWEHRALCMRQSEM